MNIEHYENILERLSIFDGLESDIQSISFFTESEDQFLVHLNLAKSGHQVYKYKDVMPYQFVKYQNNNTKKTAGSSRIDFIRALDGFINSDVSKGFELVIDMMHLSKNRIGIAYCNKDNKLDVCYWNKETDLIEVTLT